MDEIYDTLLDLGIDKARLTACMDSNDNWGKLVHAFEYITTISAVLEHWPDPEFAAEESADIARKMEVEDRHE
jgi:hypothetical protein